MLLVPVDFLPCFVRLGYRSVQLAESFYPQQVRVLENFESKIEHITNGS